MTGRLLLSCFLLLSLHGTAPPALDAQAGGERTYPTPRLAEAHDRERQKRALAKIASMMRERMAAMHAPGLSWGVVIDGEIVATEGIGEQRAGSGVPLTPDSVFRIASMTKSVTALAILKLRDAGRLALDDPASKYVPALAKVPLPTRDSPAITIRHLLTHSAGFPEDNPWGDRQLAVSIETMERWLAGGIPFSTVPGTQYEYSNYGFAILGRVVAAASGTTYREYVDREILQPLGLTSSYWDARDVPEGRLAQGYRRTGDTLEPETPLGDGAFGSMGGLYMSGRDLGRYIAYLLSAWPPRDDADTGPVRRASLREMQQFWRPSGFEVSRAAPDAPVRALTWAYGYGLRIARDCAIAHSVGHGGGLPGYGSYMHWLPEYGAGVYVMANVTYAPAGRPAREAIDMLISEGAIAPRRLPPSPMLIETRNALTALVNDWTDAGAQALAADNLFLDRPLATRRAEVEALRRELGPCSAGEIAPENWLRGRFPLQCRDGRIDVTFTLSPTMPPKVQALSFAPQRKPPESLTESARSVVALLNQPDPGRAAALLAPPLTVDALQRQVAAVGLLYGSCRAGEITSPDGSATARLALTCDRGELDATLSFDAAGRLRELSLRPPAGATCVP